MARQVGDFARPDINIMLRMASHDISWVPSTHVRFEDLDFIIMVGEELALAHAAIQPLLSIGLDTVDEADEEVQLHAPRAHALGNI